MQNISLSNLSIKHLVEELKILENGFLNKAQTLENGWLKLKIHTKQGDKNLIITPNAVFISEKSLQAKQSPGGFSALLKKHLFNKKILSIKQHSMDRIILIEFPENFLVIELFARGNVVLCNKEMKIIKAMRREEWKDRKLEANQEYKYPTSKGTNPLEETNEGFFKKLSESKKTFFGAVVDILNVSPQILEFVFETKKLDKKKDSTKASKEEAIELLEKIKEIYSSKEEKPYLSQGILFSTKTLLEKEKSFESLNSALNELFVKENSSAIISQNQEKKKNIVETIENEIRKLEIEEKNLRRKGELIYENYDAIETLVNKVKEYEKTVNQSEMVDALNSTLMNTRVKVVSFSKNRLILKIE